MSDREPPPATEPDPSRAELEAIDDALRRLAADRAAVLDDRARRLAEIDAEERRLWDRRRTVTTAPAVPATAWPSLPPPPGPAQPLPRSGAALRSSLPPPPVSPSGGPGVVEAREGEWRPLVLRNTLLVVGTVLLALAALVFAVVAWPRLGEAGRAVLLAGATVVTAGMVVRLGRRLPATTEALTAVLLALALVDWLALRRVGLGGDVRSDLWWVVGTALVAVLALGVGGRRRLVVGRVLGVALAGASLGLAAALPRSLAAAALLPSVAGAVVMVVSGLLWTDRRWRDAAVTAAVVAWLLATQGLATTTVLVVDRGAGPVTGLALALTGCVPAACRWAWRRHLDRGVGSVLVAWAALALEIGVVVALADPVPGAWVATVAVAVGGAALVAARFVRSGHRAGPVVAGSVVAAVGLVPALDVLRIVGGSAWAWTADPWTLGATAVFRDAVPSSTGPDGVTTTSLTGAGAATATALVVAVAAWAAASSRPPGRPVAPAAAGAPTAIGATGAAVLLGAVAAGATYGVLAVSGVVVAVGVALVLGRIARRAEWLVLAVAPLVAAGGWSLADAWLMVATIAATASGGVVVAQWGGVRRAFPAGVAMAALLGLGPALVVAADDGDLLRALPLVVLTAAVGGSLACVAAAAPGWRDGADRLAAAVPGLAAVVLAALGAADAWSENGWPVATAAAVAGLAALAVAVLAPSRAVARSAAVLAVPLAASGAALGVSAGGWGPELGGVVAVLVAAAGLAAAPHVAPPRVAVAFAGGASATVVVALVELAVLSVPWPGGGAHALAVSLTLVAVGAGLAALGRGWGPVGPVAIVAAVAAGWSWLGVVGVTVVEAYSLPAAVVAGTAGWRWRRREGSRSSWIAYGPALALGVAPSLVLALGGHGGRAVGVALVGLVLVVVGVAARLQAPVAVGVAALVAVAVHTVAPVAARVPRWVALGAAGVIVLWLGATVERRLRQARRWSRRFGALR